MITYEAVFNNTKNKGVFSISLVNDPAMEGLFVALSKETEIKLAEVDTEQRILMGLVLEPNKPVYRNQNGEEFNIVFKEDTIKELSHNFFKAGHQKDSSLEHDSSIEGVTFVESWIVENSAIDKSANFGFSYPKGSWIATMKVDSDEIWNDYVKTGKVQGFSVDAMVDLKKINSKTEVSMSQVKVDGIVAAIKEGFATVFSSKEKEVKEDVIGAEVKLGSVKSDGVDLFYEGDTPEVGAAIWLQGDDESKIPLPVGDYPIDGGVLVVSEEGLVGALNAEGEAVEEEMADEGASDTAQAEAITQAIKSVLVKYEAVEAKLEKVDGELIELQKENEELKAEVLELSKEPAVKTKKSSVAQNVVLSRVEQMRANRGRHS